MFGQMEYIHGVMAGLVPAIPIIWARYLPDRDPRDKPAGDAGEWDNC